MIALREMGLEPLPYDPADDDEARAITYRYVESGLPTIAGVYFPREDDDAITVTGHSITVVGHTFVPKEPDAILETEDAEAAEFCFTGTFRFAPRFVVQDDAGGPFRYLEYLDWETAVADGLLTAEVAQMARDEGKYGCVAVLDRGEATQDTAFLRSLLIPLPEGVTLDGYGAEERAVALAKEYFEEAEVIHPPCLTVRTMLQPSNALKQSLNGPGVPRPLSREIRRHQMPKWVWVTEFGDIRQLDHGGPILAHVVQDSASHPTSTDFFDLIAFNFPGIIAVQYPDEDVRVVSVQYTAYPRFERPYPLPENHG